MSAGPVAAEWLPPTLNGSPSVAAMDWRSRLIRSKTTKDGLGAPKALLANAITALREAPEWKALYHSMNSHSQLCWFDLPHGAVLLEWNGLITRIGSRPTGYNIRVSSSQSKLLAKPSKPSRECSFHPVREYLNSLKWDRTKRIAGWLSLYLGSEPTEYTAAVGARSLISAVARIFSPGAKADSCLILEGEQGTKKSTALKVLAQPWFTDEIAELGSKDAALQTHGVWIIEIAELDSMNRSEVGEIKAFMSRTTDRFRPPYGRRLIESPRQCIFAGSVNHTNYLRDETGARRFWPVQCARVLINELARDRDQLWAESVACYRAGAPWWLDTAELTQQAKAEQSARYEGDAWDPLVLEWARGRLASGCDSISVGEVLEVCLDKKKADGTGADEMTIGRSLRAAKWARYRDRQRGMEWRYRPPVPTSGGNAARSGNTTSD